MQREEKSPSAQISSYELMAMGGFALFCCWMFACFYWFACGLTQFSGLVDRGIIQFPAFVFIVVGYAIVHALAKNSSWNLFGTPVILAASVCALAQPIFVMVGALGVFLPMPVYCIGSALAGIGASFYVLFWLDTCSRLGADHYSRFTGVSLLVGAVFFVVVAFLPPVMQALVPALCILASFALLMYTSVRVSGNADAAPLESVANTWRFTKEIEPSFFIFGILFALTFSFLFKSGQQAMLVGCASTVVGFAVVALLSTKNKQVSITVYQRFLVVVTLAAGLVLPFVEYTGQLICSCVTTAAWGMFTAINYSYIVKKCVIAREAPLFRQAPSRLAIPAGGFACGWLLALIVTALVSDGSNLHLCLRLAAAIALVLVVMIFIPEKQHHLVDGQSPEKEKVTTEVVTVDMSEHELFEARCAAVAKLYQLSPREEEILGYLARGRNAAYIQDELTISANTVKSHIYNVYRKLDIHSQQKLMDFVEQFPLD